MLPYAPLGVHPILEPNEVGTEDRVNLFENQKSLRNAHNTSMSNSETNASFNHN